MIQCFKVGDRVEIVDGPESLIGEKGTVFAIGTTARPDVGHICRIDLDISQKEKRRVSLFACRLKHAVEESITVDSLSEVLYGG